MKINDLIALIVTSIISVIAYLSSNNWVIFGIVFVLYIASYFLFIRKKTIIYSKRIKRIHSCYHFINSFVITMSVQHSLEESYLNAIKINDIDLRDVTDGIEENSISEQIEYLKTYFNLALYKVFLNVLRVYQDQGGSILTVSENLLKESTRVERSLRESTRITNKKLVEFVLLWSISFGILLFMRFGISDFYYDMLKSNVFVVMLVLFFVFALGSVVIFVNRCTKVAIKEDYE